jgi:hypothetical protein
MANRRTTNSSNSSLVPALLIRFNKSQLRVLRRILADWVFLLDVCTTTLGWVELIQRLASEEDSRFNLHSDSGKFVCKLCALRLYRFLQLIRFAPFFFFFRDLRTLLVGIWSGIKSVLWAFAIYLCMVVVWAVIIRQTVVLQWRSDMQLLQETFPTIPRSIFIIFRCMALNEDGACLHSQHESFIPLLSEQFGAFFDLTWLMSKVLMMFALFNVLVGVFVGRTSEQAAKIREEIQIASQIKDREQCQSLDKLLRTLIHPYRDSSNPKDMCGIC